MNSYGDDSIIDWQGQIPQKEQPQIESILDKKILRNTRNKTFFQYLVKWKNHPTKDVPWVTDQEISKYNVHREDLMKNSFLPKSMMQEHPTHFSLTNESTFHVNTTRR